MGNRRVSGKGGDGVFDEVFLMRFEIGEFWMGGFDEFLGRWEGWE